MIEINNLVKKYGDHTAVDHLSLVVEPGKIYGFLGPNGAGKTTTMKMILGFLKPDSGIIRVCGEEVKFGETKTNKFIGYLPDVPEYDVRWKRRYPLQDNTDSCFLLLSFSFRLCNYYTKSHGTKKDTLLFKKCPYLQFRASLRKSLCSE